MDNLHITAIKFEDGDDLWHGALYCTEQTPSDSTRVRLLKSDPRGCKTPQEAVVYISSVYPDVTIAIK